MTGSRYAPFGALFEVNMIQEELKSILHYDPLTGLWKWLIRVGGQADNKEYAGSSYTDQCGMTYRQVKYRGRSYKLHRLAFLYMEGYMPDFVDHIDGNGENNIWTNLRPCTKEQNAHNRKKPVNNTSGHKGVTWYPRYKQWCARIGFNGKRVLVGYFDTIEDAVSAIVEKRKEFHKDFANNG